MFLHIGRAIQYPGGSTTVGKNECKGPSRQWKRTGGNSKDAVRGQRAQERRLHLCWQRHAREAGLSPSYSGPYQVLKRNWKDSTFKLMLSRWPDNVSLSRLKVTNAVSSWLEGGLLRLCSSDGIAMASDLRQNSSLLQDIPIAATRWRYRPDRSKNVVSFEDSSSSGIWWYPLVASNLQNTQKWDRAQKWPQHWMGTCAWGGAHTCSNLCSPPPNVTRPGPVLFHEEPRGTPVRGLHLLHDDSGLEGLLHAMFLHVQRHCPRGHDLGWPHLPWPEMYLHKVLGLVTVRQRIRHHLGIFLDQCLSNRSEIGYLRACVNRFDSCCNRKGPWDHLKPFQVPKPYDEIIGRGGSYRGWCIDGGGGGCNGDIGDTFLLERFTCDWHEFMRSWRVLNLNVMSGSHLGLH